LKNKKHIEVEGIFNAEVEKRKNVEVEDIINEVEDILMLKLNKGRLLKLRKRIY
jgi:hypothetical protein